MTKLTFKLRGEARLKAEAKLVRQQQIIDDFGAHLEDQNRRRSLFHDTTELPHPKDDILEALLTEISYTNITKAVPILEAAAITLASYQPGIAGYALDLPDPAKLQSIINDNEAFKTMLNGYDAEKARELGNIKNAEMAEITRWIGNAKRANPHLRPFYERWWRNLTRYPK